MRLTLCRGLVFGALLLPCAAAVTAQPPATLPDKLKADTAALAADRAAAESASTERAKLQADLRRLLEKIDRVPTGPGPMMPPVTPVPIAKGKDDGGTAPVDRLRSATNLVRDNKIEAALGAFRLIDLQQLTADDRAFARYMTAACLRRLGRPAEALPIYREVADAGDDPFVSSSALSQVNLLRASEELEAQLVQLRARPKNR